MNRRRVALFITRAALRILPASRAEWAAAMLAELDYVDDDHALGWALGYVWTSTRERISTMNQLDSRPMKRLKWASANALIAAVFSAIAILAVTFVLKHTGHIDFATSIALAAGIVPYSILSSRRRCSQ